MKRVWIVVIALSLLPWTGFAQDAAPIRVEGRLIWRAGQTAVIAPDGTPSVNIARDRRGLDRALSAPEA